MNMLHKRRALMLIGCVLVAGMVAAIPMLASNYMMLVLNNTIIYFIAALGITLMLGMCGQMSFSAVAFMGLAGFLAAQLSKTYGVHTLLAGAIAVAVTGLVSNGIGRLLLKLKGSYFTFATIGLVQIFSSIFLNFKPLSGGADGTSSVPKLNLILFTPSSRAQWFYVFAVVAVLCALVVERIRRSHLGRAAASVRDNEIAASTLGVNVYQTKVTCFTIASTLAALSGVLLVYHNSYAVESMFSYDISVNFILMVMLGGVNSTVGTLFGSGLMTLLPELLRGFQQYLRLIYGVGIILLMVFMPMGLAGVFGSLIKRGKAVLRRGKGETPHEQPYEEQ